MVCNKRGKNNGKDNTRGKTFPPSLSFHDEEIVIMIS
jgi:hypothetical protein